MITNLQNPGIKNIVKLQEKSSVRKKKKKFVIEGRRELSIAQQCGVDIFEIYLCEDIYTDDIFYPVKTDNIKKIPVNTDVYNKIAYRDNSEGIIGIANMKEACLSKIELSSLPLILIIENVEKPGNLGAILRTADAAGVDAVIVCSQQTDIYNPNVIRSSMGAVFSNRVVTCTGEETIKWLNDNFISVFSAVPDSGTFYYDIDYVQPAAIVFGAESKGLSQNWVNASKQTVKIPMTGKTDSLNVSVSTAIILYEAVRQRQINSCQ